MKRITLTARLLPFLLGAALAHASPPGESAANPNAVCTFECAGLYWTTAEAGPCTVRYAEGDSGAWRQGYDLIFDARDGQYRGSLVGLKPATRYRAELATASAKTTLTFTTRDDRFKIGRITRLPAEISTNPIVITTSGTPDAYHLVTTAEGARSVLDLRNSHPNGIVVDADYVIIDGIEIRNAAHNAIFINARRHDIVVQNTHCTFWGRIGGPKTYGNFEGNYDSGVFAEAGTYNLTIQRNLFDHPRGAANNWETGHPTGPEGICLNQSRGGHVIRYNDIRSSEDHGFNDAIGGSVNFSDVGNINRDSDIYGNFIENVWDDAIECEGANMNVRIWGNYLNRYFNCLATACTHRGPIYLFRNVLATSRRSPRDTHGGNMFKTGSNEKFGGGKRLIFHNTAVQPNGPFSVLSYQHESDCITRNNLFDVPGALGQEAATGAGSDFGYDYFSGLTQFGAEIHHRINAQRPHHRGLLFAPTQRLEFYPSAWITHVEQGRQTMQFGDQTLPVSGAVKQIRSPLIDSGVRLPGFNDDFSGAAPDVGAFETGRPPLEFGRRAYLKFDEGWAPWEK